MTRGDRNKAKQTRCRILFDSGSQRSYITQNIAKKLNLSIEKDENLSVYTFGSRSPREFNSPVVQLELETKSKKGKIIYANIVPMISQSVPYAEELNNWRYKVELADDGSLTDQVDILIGNDYYYSFLHSEKIRISEDLYLVDSEFGWILSGQGPRRDMEEQHMSVITYFQTEIDFKFNKPDMPLDQGSIAFLWELESIGITDSPKITREEEAIHKFNETTKLINNRYHVSWPWNEYPPSLTPNYGLAYGRLVNLVKRLDKETLKSYNDAIQEQISKGIVEEVLDKTRVEHPVHYLPHHCVAQKNKPIRIVYDASSKIKGNKSLNECLYCGPLMLEDLTCILIRFRSHNIALAADVEKAFLQIGLHEKDRDVTRFIWLKDVEKPPHVDNIICLRFCRVPFGIISSPFLLNATIKHHLSKGNEQLQLIAKDIYVDNLVTGVQTLDEAIQIYQDTKDTFGQISMNLRDWSSNSKQFMNRIPDGVKEKVVKILGLDWNLKHDTLHVKFTLTTEAYSKREVLKVIASIYDPCGFGVPHVLSAKLFLQELWKTKVKWDTKFSKEMQDKWSEIRKELETIRGISIPRCYIKNVKGEEYHLHCFTDASLKAYAAVVYITHGAKTSFVIGKTRLIPIKDQQHLKIPRLELLGALIGCRLIKMVLKAFNMKLGYQTLWTDSQIVIEWCQSDKLLPPFVSRRVEEIRSNKELMIKYVPSELNPADIATRPMSSNEDKERWLTGPQFLSESDKQKTPVKYMSQSFFLSTREGLPNTSKEKDSNLELQNNFSGESIRAKEDSRTSYKESLCITETIKKLQAEYFTQEVAGKETDLSRNLKLFKDVDGLLRCKGRLQNAELSFDKRYPILIPKECDFTNNLIKKVHNDNYHVGANHTLSLIRQSYWIPKGKSQIQRILKKCPRCIKHGAGPFKLPPTPALPVERVGYSEPFTFVGIDYMGPVLVKSGQKRWICLFTCLAVRAIHLELVQDLTAEEGLLALRRTIATRKVPQLITSDNATHFKLIAEILSKQYCIDNKIQWKFIPQLTPWFGGFDERLIGIVKNCMKRTLAKHMLSDSQLTTVVKEIEAVINSRPLTCVDSELDIILKPADFLTLGSCITIEGTVEDCLEKGTTIKVDLIKSWKRGLIIVREFKDMFVNRYLLSLRERYQHSHKEPRVTSKQSPAIGQIVQIKGENKNRETWRVGKIVSLKEGSDGLCRVAIVKVGDKNFTRSIAHLYPLEVQESEEDMEERFIRDDTSSELASATLAEPLEESTDRQITISEGIAQEENSPMMQIDEPIQETMECETLESESRESIGDVIDSEGVGTLARDEEKEEDGRVGRVRRVAATKALQRIKEWTNNLLCLF
ncbi:uncharacterized protein LOC123879305 [Maniola jurtina]|uniref:uncharacterized protein LOC123879305 n=1 Tax=Maniola jurtina TaxID=191418 RepID=UPI001E686A1A|nr:uncharacterized protein LOC123879305 [Maniola jurtina]